MSIRNKRWEEIANSSFPLNPDDTLSYYDQNLHMTDPTLGLSTREKKQIDTWMAISENASSEPDEIALSYADKVYLNSLNRKANALPRSNNDFIPPVDFYAVLENLHSRVYTWFKGAKWSKFTEKTNN